jgi:hypothetical protein
MVFNSNSRGIMEGCLRRFISRRRRDIMLEEQWETVEERMRSLLLGTNHQGLRGKGRKR